MYGIVCESVSIAKMREEPMRIERELMRGAGPVAVLQLLEKRPMYGYELAWIPIGPVALTAFDQ